MVSLLFYVASLYLAQGDVRNAETEYQTAIELDPDYIPAYVNFADLYRVTGEEEKGAKIL